LAIKTGGLPDGSSHPSFSSIAQQPVVMRDLILGFELTNRGSIMPRTPARLTFNQAIDALRAHGFDVSAFAAISGAFLVSKYCAAAVLVPSNDAFAGPAAFAEYPGILVRGQVARLLDRGYQKFIKTSQYELPATADQLQAIHQFSEELTRLTGGTSLYNQSLGTTSDLYEYDRLRGRKDDAPPAAGRPWDLPDGH
jgi:hypothetical protein